MIWGLANSGSWMCMIIDKTATTEDFGVFMYMLRSYINKCNYMKLKVITAVVDNASIHLTSLSKPLWRFLNIELLELLQYCPHLAPVELVFGMTKRILIRQVPKEGVDFSKPEGQTTIIRALESLTNQKEFNMWKRVIYIWKAIVVEVWSKTKTLMTNTQIVDSLMTSIKENSQEKAEKKGK